MMTRLACLTIAALALSAQCAHAQWMETSETDVFTGETATVLTNSGTVIEGEPSISQLEYRQLDGEDSLELQTALTAFCSGDLRLEYRADGSDPVATSIVTNRSRNTVLLTDLDRHYRDIVSAQDLLFSLRDNCGYRKVLRFSGSASAQLDDLSTPVLDTAWKFERSSGYVSKDDGPARFQYRILNTGEPDISILLPRTDEISLSTGRAVRVLIGEENFLGRTAMVKRQIGPAAHTYKIYFETVRDNEAFLQQLETDHLVTVRTPKADITLDLSGWRDALPLAR